MFEKSETPLGNKKKKKNLGKQQYIQRNYANKQGERRTTIVGKKVATKKKKLLIFLYSKKKTKNTNVKKRGKTKNL